ncbi:hypothetical protein LTR67_011099 [Exophiala xenobiotica]
MLPPPVVLAAVPQVLRIAIWIYENGFRSPVEGAPDHQYATFGREVRSFATNLERLQNALQRAIDQRLNYLPSPSPEDDDDLDLEPFRKLVGDYEGTLKACRKLLENNTSFQRSADGVIRRVLWNTMLAADVAELRNRINFHNTRLVAVLRPLELTLYVKLREDIRRLHQDVQEVITRLARIEGVILGNILAATDAAEQELAESLPVVPGFLRGRFASASQTVPEDHITDQLRLSSLVGHFASGTHRFRPGIEPGPEPCNFVSLWKSVWLMQRLKESASYQRFSRSRLNASIVKEYERLILGETKKFDIGAEVLLQDIENLPSIKFTMWILEPSTTRRNLAEPGPEEIKVFDCSLVDASITESHGLVVLASLARPNILRIVEIFTSKIGGKDREQQDFIDVTRVKLLPTYAQPGATVCNLQMRSSAEATMESLFSFKRLETLHLFQQCLTGFYVELDLPGVTKVSYKAGGMLGLPRAQTIGTYGRVQLWTHELSKDESKRRRQGSITNGTSFTPSSQTDASKTLVDWTSIHTPSVIWRGQRAELPYPETPLIVLTLATIGPDLTDSPQTLYSLLAVYLDGSVIIDESRCDCRNHDETCTRVVVSSRSRLYAKLFEYGDDVNAMNIAVLRMPQLQDERKKYLKQLNDVGRVSIDFGSVKDKTDFRKRFREVVDNYIGLWQDYQRQIANIRTNDYVGRRQ